MTQRHYNHDKPPPQPDPPSPRENLDESMKEWNDKQFLDWNEIKDAVKPK